MMTWQEWAVEVARCWARPRVGGFPPSAPLSYMAEKAFWQASNVCGFTGDLEAWTEAVEAALGSPAPAPERKPVPKVPAPAQLAQPVPVPVQPVAPPAPAFDDLEEWLNK